MADETGRIKGVAFREFIVWYEDTYGKGSITRALEGIDAGLKGMLMPHRPYLGVLDASWYPAPLVHELLDRLSAGKGEAERTRMARGAARAIMNQTLGGIYKNLFRVFATPALYARFAPMLWKSYYDSGVIEIDDAPGRADLRIRDWAAHHDLICEMHCEAGLIIYETMGLREVKAKRVGCVSGGEPACTFVVNWSK